MVSHNSTPIPPAPTMPTTVAERTLDSKRYNTYEIHRGNTCGITPKIISCNELAPVARIPSTGPGSIDSTASANNLANTPVVPTNSAKVPAKGPKPTATTN